MKIDEELLYEIMSQLEAGNGTTIVNVEVPGRTDREIQYHLKHLIQIGFAEGPLNNPMPSDDGDYDLWWPWGLTPAGHSDLEQNRLNKPY